MSHEILIATRNPDKLREIRTLLAPLSGISVVGLDDLGISPVAAEETLEQFSTFEENALAKARFFAQRTGVETLADDSGLCVDALKGRPGVRSRRFSGRDDLRGAALDEANNRVLLEALRGVSEADRSARFVCAVALVEPDGAEQIFLGACDGMVLPEPFGVGGFGYDPLFFLPEVGVTFAELDPDRKNALSHRGRALRQLGESLQRG